MSEQESAAPPTSLAPRRGRRLRIVSGGDLSSTMLIDIESGEFVDGVVSLGWACAGHNPGGVAVVTVVLERVQLDVLVTAQPGGETDP